MKRNTGNILLIIFFFMVIIFGCKKDNADYLEKYTGSYTFTITKHHQIWIYNYDTIYTITFDGHISKYSGDLNNAHRRLTIDFGTTIEPEVLESGEFITESSGGSYYLSGHFVNSDEVTYELIKGSVGFRMEIDVKGKRK